MSNTPEIINQVFEIEDPLLNGIIRSEYSAYNMTQEECENRIKSMMSNPELRKAMADFTKDMQDKGE